MKNEAGSKEARAEELCLDCGLCCNGVIFARVQLQAEDKVVIMSNGGFDGIHRKMLAALQEKRS